ncbi:hypothetical protein Tco_0672711 [Tanacetum coccineum]
MLNSDRTESDIIKTPVLNQSSTEYYEEEEEKINDEETMDDEEEDKVTKELYKDVNVKLGNEDTEMTNADQGGSEQQNVSQESGFEQVEEDGHVTITPVFDTQKADEPVQSSSVSSDFTSKLLNLENPSPADNEIASLMETSTRHATGVPEITSSFTTTIPPPPLFFNPLPQQATPTPTPTTSEATTSFTSLLDFSSVFKFNDRVTNLEKDLSKIKQRSRDDKDKDQDPFDGSYQGTKQRKSSKEAESSRDSRSKEKKSSTTFKDASQSQHKHSEFDTGNNDEQPADKEVSKADWFKKPERPLTPNSDWNKRQHVDSQPPQTWIKSAQHYRFDSRNSGWTGIRATQRHLQDVYSRKQIIAVTRLTIMKKYDYGHLEEFEVCREDQKLYNFREESDQSYNRRTVCLECGITSNLRNGTTYTAYLDPKGVIYKDQNNRNRLMRADELHKFSDGAHDDVRTALNDIAKGIRMEYLPKRKWSGLDNEGLGLWFRISTSSFMRGG